MHRKCILRWFGVSKKNRCRFGVISGCTDFGCLGSVVSWRCGCPMFVPIFREVDLKKGYGVGSFEIEISVKKYVNRHQSRTRENSFRDFEIFDRRFWKFLVQIPMEIFGSQRGTYPHENENFQFFSKK